ncbi:hypothetical protein [uncultured Ruegeria sp.]|uniref:hypothetical protein n=1 Tax=uncultured Ruegeria sp. TaxID=259304 RepID=UPI002639F71F|nr:hypothetical protein [uncultured Ruegeria sp.]
MTVSFTPISPWTGQMRADVLAVASSLAELDRAEIFGLRPDWHTPADLTADVATLIASGLLLDGFVAYRQPARDLMAEPFAVALAFRSALPHVAELALFGAKGHERAIPAVYNHLDARRHSFGAKHGIRLAQLPVLKDHRAARRMIKRLGGAEAFDYGPIGKDGASYIHVIWRF